jgi:hypothetical protein
MEVTPRRIEKSGHDPSEGWHARDDDVRIRTPGADARPLTVGAAPSDISRWIERSGAEECSNAARAKKRFARSVRKDYGELSRFAAHRQRHFRGDGSLLRNKALLGSVTVVVLLVAATAALAANFEGTRGPDTIPGTASADRIDGRGGDDTITGDGGGDKIRGGSGDDKIDGDHACRGKKKKPPYCVPGRAGKDRIYGGSGQDTINGDEGDDIVSGQNGDDRVRGDDGNDRVRGGSGDDILRGGNGNDAITGGSGKDQVFGGAGNDQIIVRDGKVDNVNCGPGRDRVKADRKDRIRANCEKVTRK